MHNLFYLYSLKFPTYKKSLLYTVYRSNTSFYMYIEILFYAISVGYITLHHTPWCYITWYISRIYHVTLHDISRCYFTCINRIHHFTLYIETLLYAIDLSDKSPYVTLHEKSRCKWFIEISNNIFDNNMWHIKTLIYIFKIETRWIATFLGCTL